jgi:hypothetical protein
MADKKISALTAATTPLAGTEVLPIVQSGATVKVAVSDLTAGRAISATQLTLTTGNLIVASGQGIDFSATPGTGTSELLADYEEGTWTPTIVMDSGTSVGGTFSGLYTKIGRQVTLTISADVGTVALSPTIGGFSNLPFTSINDSPVAVGSLRENANTGNMFQWRVNKNGTTSFVARYDNNAVVSNGDTFLGTVTYFV